MVEDKMAEDMQTLMTIDESMLDLVMSYDDQELSGS
jgi:hypothetical protein